MDNVYDDDDDYDEETGDPPACVFCGSIDECPHLVAVIDRTWGECVGGPLYNIIGKLRNVLTDGIDRCLQAAYANPKNCSIPEFVEFVVLEDLSPMDFNVDDADAEFPPEYSVNTDAFFEWLIDALCAAGAEQYPGDIEEFGPGGESLVIERLYALEPKLVFERTEKMLMEKFAK